MRVMVRFEDMNPKDRGIVSWLHRIPKDKQYRDEREMLLKCPDGSYRKETVLFDIGFIVENESDPLIAEFEKKFPHTPFRIEV